MKWIITFIAVLLLVTVPVLMVVFIVKYWKYYLVAMAFLFFLAVTISYSLKDDNDDLSF